MKVSPRKRENPFSFFFLFPWSFLYRFSYSGQFSILSAVQGRLCIGPTVIVSTVFSSYCARRPMVKKQVYIGWRRSASERKTPPNPTTFNKKKNNNRYNRDGTHNGRIVLSVRIRADWVATVFFRLFWGSFVTLRRADYRDQLPPVIALFIFVLTFKRKIFIFLPPRHLLVALHMASFFFL